MLQAITPKFKFAHAKVAEVTTLWLAELLARFDTSLTRIERELRKASLDLSEETYGTVERAAASFGIVGLAPANQPA